jgi:hypothetical protein
VRRTTSLTAAALISLTAPALAMTGQSAANGAAETCQGRTPTVIGSGHRVDGTEGPDVILTNGARSVYALGGDDLICISGPYTGKNYPVFVRAGDGNDVVDGTGSPRQEVYAFLASGVDTFLGGDARDFVELDHPDAAGGVDTVHGGGGSDSIRIQTGPGDVVVDNEVGRFTSAGEVRTTWTSVEGFGIDQSTGSQRMTFVGTDADESPWAAVTTTGPARPRRPRRAASSVGRVATASTWPPRRPASTSTCAPGPWASRPLRPTS